MSVIIDGAQPIPFKVYQIRSYGTLGKASVKSSQQICEDVDPGSEVDKYFPVHTDPFKKARQLHKYNKENM